MNNLGDLLRAKGLAATETPDTPAEEAQPAAASEPRYGPKVVVRSTRKGRGGKTVTEVQGVVAARDELAKRLKKSLGVGARVEDDLIVVQGDQRDRLVTWLEKNGVRKVVRG